MKKLYFSIVAVLTLSLSLSASIYEPTLTAPTDGAVNRSPDVLLDWMAVTGGQFYQVHVDTSASFTNPEVYLTQYSAINAVDLYFGETYNWRVRAIAGNDTSVWSDVRNFTVSHQLEIYNQLDTNITNAMPSEELRWRSWTGLISYYLQFDTTDQYNSPCLLTTTISAVTASTYAPQLKFGENYYWRICAIHARDTSDWSDDWTISVIDTFNLKTPADGIIDVHPDQKLAWDEIQIMNGYDLYMDTAASFSNPIMILADTNLYENTELMFGATYFWKVRALHSHDTSQWIGDWSFTVISKPELNAPADNATEVELQPTLEWDEISSVTAYEIAIDTDPGFANPTVILMDTLLEAAYTFDANLPSQTDHYWKVRTMHASDTSDWSDVYQFRTTWGVGIEEITTFNSLEVYPNPTKGMIYLEADASGNMLEVTVMDIVGQTFMKESYRSGSSKKAINIGHLPNGIYFIKVSDGNKIITRKVMLDK